MSDLNDLWNEANEGFNKSEEISAQEIRQAIQAQSRSPMQKLYKQVKLKFWLCILFTPMFIALLFYAEELVSRVLLLIIYVGYLVAALLYWDELKALKKQMNYTKNLRRVLQSYHDRVVRVVKAEENIGLFFYPVALIAGMLVQGDFSEGSFPDGNKDWIIMVVVITLLTPPLHLLGKWMNRKSFGKHLDQLQSYIDTFLT